MNLLSLLWHIANCYYYRSLETETTVKNKNNETSLYISHNHYLCILKTRTPASTGNGNSSFVDWSSLRNKFSLEENSPYSWIRLREILNWDFLHLATRTWGMVDLQYITFSFHHFLSTPPPTPVLLCPRINPHSSTIQYIPRFPGPIYTGTMRRVSINSILRMKSTSRSRAKVPFLLGSVFSLISLLH